MSDPIPMKRALKLPLALQEGLTEHELRRWRDNGLLPVQERRNGPTLSRFFVDPDHVEALIQSTRAYKTIKKPVKPKAKKTLNSLDSLK